MLLEIKHATVYYEKSMALDDVSLKVAEGEVVTIIGANGAGKSTLMRAISALVPLISGEIWFSGRRIDRIPTHEIVRMGIGHIPEDRKLFPYLTVMNNLKLGASLRKDKGGINRDIDEIFERFPILGERHNQLAGTLSGGQQQMLAIARGLMARPKLLLMDEPSLGLAPLMIDEVGRVIQYINERGVSVLLVEQNVSLAFRISTRGYALQVGKVVFKGNVEQLKSPETIRKAYLGA